MDKGGGEATMEVKGSGGSERVVVESEGSVDGSGVRVAKSDSSVDGSGAAGVVEPKSSDDAIVGVGLAGSVSKSCVDGDGAVAVGESVRCITVPGAERVAESVTETGPVGVAESVPKGPVDASGAERVTESEGSVDGSGVGTAEVERAQTAAIRV